MIRVEYRQSGATATRFVTGRESLMFIVSGVVVSTVMSFPEGPVDAEATHEETDAVDPAPTDGVVATLTRPLRRHVETWSRRYVEMRVEARRGL